MALLVTEARTRPLLLLLLLLFIRGILTIALVHQPTQTANQVHL